MFIIIHTIQYYTSIQYREKKRYWGQSRDFIDKNIYCSFNKLQNGFEYLTKVLLVKIRAHYFSMYNHVYQTGLWGCLKQESICKHHKSCAV